MEPFTPLNIVIYAALVLALAGLVVFAAGRNRGWSEALLAAPAAPEVIYVEVPVAPVTAPAVVELAALYLAPATGPIDVIPGAYATLPLGPDAPLEVVDPWQIIAELRAELEQTRMELAAAVIFGQNADRLRRKHFKQLTLTRRRLNGVLAEVMEPARRPTKKALLGKVVTLPGRQLAPLVPQPVARDWRALAA